MGNYHPHASHGVASAMAELVSVEVAAGLESALYSPRSRPRTQATEPRTGVPFFTGAPGLTDAFLEFQPDVVHLHYLFHPEHQPTIRLARSKALPYIVSPHGALHPAELSKTWAKRVKKSMYLRWRDLGNLDGALRVRAVTEQEASTIRTHTQAPVRVLPNPYLREGRLQRSARRGTTLGFLGRLDIRNKGLDLLCKAAADCATRLGESVTLRIAGQSRDGRAEVELKKLTEDCGAPVLLELCGVVTGEEKRAFLGSLDVYVHLARWELYGMSILEAMDVGVPAVVAATCDIASTLDHAGAATIVPLDATAVTDSIVRLLEDPSVVKRQIDAAEVWLATVSPDALAGPVRSLYELP